MEEEQQPQPQPQAEPQQQGQAEGEKGEEEEPAPARCRRHPTQLLTGICSSCLMERLSSVRDHPEDEIVEVGESSAAASGGGGGDTGRLRKTLMLLFQLDDCSSSGSCVAPPSESGDPRAAELEADSGGGGDREGKRKSGSWLRSILPRRGMRWRRNGGSRKEPSQPPPEGAVDPAGTAATGGDAQVERKPSFRRSFDWMVCREPSRGTLEPPRHSWDGSMVGRAFACSFACLEEPPDTARRARRSNAEEAVREARAVVAERRNGSHSVDSGGLGRRFRGRSCGDTGPDITVSGVGRRRSNRWSRVWDRSITSPLKEFVRKGEHVLERSLSESRKEIRRGKNAEAAEINGEIQPGHNGHGLGRASQAVSRSSQAVSNGDAYNFRADWLRNKECKIGRSRSVHYTSPGNLDNGMLRFYLTPMRSTRTANRGRRRNSRLFARGLFGFI